VFVIILAQADKCRLVSSRVS